MCMCFQFWENLSETFLYRLKCKKLNVFVRSVDYILEKEEYKTWFPLEFNVLCMWKGNICSNI